MTKSYSFAAVADARARVLVLGSLPGRVSLAKRQYYALPHNSFWKIMGELFAFAPAAPYPRRLAHLRASGVALWDVCHSARRPGSLDSAIEHRSVRANDFGSFLESHPSIGTVFFNGAKAAMLYERLVLPAVPAIFRDLRRVILPSTSPAHASLTYAAKLHRWTEVREASAKVTVRRMTVADRGAVLAINAQSSPHVAALDEAELSRLLQMGAQVLVGVAADGNVVAYLIAFERACAYDGEEFLCLQRAIPDEFIYIDQVAVAPTFHGAGVGRKLYGAVGAESRSGGCAWLCCEVNEQPPNPGSMSFHEALGFTRLRSMETRDGRTVALLTRRR